MPKTTAPAARYFSTTAESVSAMLSQYSGTPQVVGDPARSKLSLTVIGRPSRGAGGLPRRAAPIRSVGLRPRAVCVLPDDGVDRRIVLLDAVEKVIEQFPRADLPRIEQRYQLGGRTRSGFWTSCAPRSRTASARRVPSASMNPSPTSFEVMKIASRHCWTMSQRLLEPVGHIGHPDGTGRARPAIARESAGARNRSPPDGPRSLEAGGRFVMSAQSRTRASTQFAKRCTTASVYE